MCHDRNTWTTAVFDHSVFPLAGGHAAVNCTQCHDTGVFAGLATDCVSCHQQDYNDTTAPNHVQAGFPTDCEVCHTIASWQGAVFDHTAFPLEGGHAAVNCNSCHSSGVFAGLPSDCVSCHQTDYDTAQPNHSAAGFATTCDDCHTINAWTGATIDHSIFALTGGHASVDCTQCHTGTVFAGLPSNCVSCHQTDYDNAVPNHAAAGFATTCDDCHTVNAWTGATIDHSIFPLTAGHATVNCTQCHTGTVFAGLPSDCVSCHQSDYDGAPDHTQFNYPTDCEMCHDSQHLDHRRI